METTGRIRDIFQAAGGQTIVTIGLSAAPEDVETLKEKDLTVVLKQYRKKRSLDANAYFHVLCDRLRTKLRMGMARCKNHLIADYGQVMYLPDGTQMVYKTNAPPEFCLELETPHFQLIQTGVENGKEVYYYRMYRGSHTYDSAEMNQLIEGTIAECKDWGIETATPDEIANMISLWEGKMKGN